MLKTVFFLEKLSIGQHTLEVPTQVGYYIFYAWYYDGDYHYNTQQP